MFDSSKTPQEKQRQDCGNPKADQFLVICQDDDGTLTLATRKVFQSIDEAERYRCGVSQDRNPRVVHVFFPIKEDIRAEQRRGGVTMEIDTTALNQFLDEQLTDMSRAELRTHSAPCPHCKCLVRYPTIARRQDIEDFQSLMEIACRVMDKFGITANLLAEIRVECAIELARRRSRERR